MDPDNRRADDVISPADADAMIPADHVEPLAGLTAPVPDTIQKFADRPVEEISPTPIGQLVPMPVVVPAPRERQRFVFLRTLLGSPKARLGAAIVLFFILVAVLAPVVAPGDPAAFVGAINDPPSAQHIFGTETQGGDVFAQTVWGARGSLLVGFGTAV